MDFNSHANVLAEYLKRVANNESLYNSYFQWKKSYCIEITSLKTNLCKLCQFLRGETNSFPPIESPLLQRTAQELVD